MAIPMFRGSQFNSRINGGQTMATENFFDGAAFGYASGHQQSQESTPPVDAVQEVKVITTSYSAQYGHTSGGFIEYTAKSGTNAFHGSGYGYFADDAFNAKGFFAVGKTPLSNNDYGVHARRTRRRFRRCTTGTTRRSSSRTSTTRGSVRAFSPASATRRQSTRSRPATSARC